MEISQSFSDLFDSLTKCFQTQKFINYSLEHVHRNSAVGVFLSKIPDYKEKLKEKIQKDYKSKRFILKKPKKNEVKTSDFEYYTKKLIKLAEINSVYFARYQRNEIRNSIEKTRK